MNPTRSSGLLRPICVFSLSLLPWALIAQQPVTPARPRIRPIEERIAGLQKIDGYFPLYWDDRTGSLYLEISRMDDPFLYTTGLAAGLGSNDIGRGRGPA